MKRTALVLVVATVVSSIPVAGQDRTRVALAPPTGATGLETAVAHALQEATRFSAPLGGAAWSRLRRTPPGTEVTLTVRGAQPARLVVVAVDDVKMSALNLAGHGLRPAVSRAIRDAVSLHPDLFTNPDAKTAFVSGPVRITAGGVFVDGRRVIEIADAVERIERRDVLRIDSQKSHVGLLVALSAAAAVAFLYFVVNPCAPKLGCG